MCSALRLRMRRGDLSEATACALVTPANDALVGNLQPMYWRFISRKSCDGAIRVKGGAELERACLDIEPLTEPRAFRRDITRWTSGVKNGPSAPVRCPAGSAIATAAGGALQADHIIHAVAPDSEFGYEGIYTGGHRDQAVSGVFAGDERTAFSQQFSPPDALLLGAYRDAFAHASRLGCRTVACPALGAGVKGWRPAVSAALALEAAAELAGAAGRRTPPVEAGGVEAGAAAPGPTTIEFVIGGAGSFADDAWRDWVRVARDLLLCEPAGADEARRSGVLELELPAGSSSEAAGGTSGGGGALLDLEAVSEWKELLLNRERGYSGKDEPLTAEQELRATKRRTTR